MSWNERPAVAASAYGDVWKEWHEGASQVVAGLSRMSALLNDAAARYTSTDADGGETIAVRSMVYLALSYDHRVVDGADAARFLTSMKERLEEGAFEV